MSGNQFANNGTLQLSGPEKEVITKRGLLLEEFLKSLSLNSLESLENGQILLPQSGGSLQSLDSLESLENGLF